MAALELKTFRSISISGVSREALIRQLEDRGVQFNEYARLLFAHPSFAPSAGVENVELVKVSMAELDFAVPALMAEIIAKAEAVGLKLCPLYLAAFLRLEYPEQEEGPYLTVASLKPETGDELPNGFYLRKLGGVLWLRGYRASEDYEWPADSEFIFRR